MKRRGWRLESVKEAFRGLGPRKWLLEYGVGGVQRSWTEEEAARVWSRRHSEVLVRGNGC